jgi:tetratricopeptide (TPR) repeat protein
MTPSVISVVPFIVSIEKNVLEALMRLSKNGWLFAITILIIAASSTVELRAQGTSADQYVAAGQQLLRSNNYTQAAQYFLAAAKLDSNNAGAYQGLGNCYYMAGRKSDALVYYQKALALQPGNTQLAQFTQNLQAQLNSSPAAPSMGMAADPLTQGSSLFQQKQYMASIPYFQSAAQQNPNDYRAFYYLGYAYYMTNNGRMSALYFAVANMKQPNASIQAYANQVNARLSPEDQQWVSNQLSQYSNSPAMASANKAASGDNTVQFGFNFSGDGNYIFSDPSQISNGAMAASVISISGTTSNILAGIGVEPYLQFGKGFELDFGATYIPIGGTLAYTWLDTAVPVGATNDGSFIYGYEDSFNTSMVMASLGFKILLPDNDLEGYLALGGDIAPVSTTFSKLPTDVNGILLNDGTADLSSGTYTTVAVGGYAKFGVDFFLSKTMSLGPFVGVQVLTATNFANGSNTLLVNQENGDVGNTATFGKTGTVPLTLDYSNVNFGVNLKFTL